MPVEVSQGFAGAEYYGLSDACRSAVVVGRTPRVGYATGRLSDEIRRTLTCHLRRPVRHCCGNAARSANRCATSAAFGGKLLSSF